MRDGQTSPAMTGNGRERAMRVAVSSALICLALMSSARAASFDCAKASSFVEKTICSDPELSAADERLGRLYKVLHAGGANNSKLEAEQKTWLASRDRCKDVDCVKQAYADRMVALSGGPASPVAEDVTGIYKMANAEALIQQTHEARIKFSLSASYRTNVGELSGEAPLSGDTATYSDREADCALSFKFAGGRLIIAQDGSCGMGLNVSAAGTYKRVSAAPPKFEE
jgi:uncharacterized protein